MIIFFPCVLKEIFKKGRNYPWPKPEKCPHCANYKVWGHGFVEAFFDGYNEPLVLKRYRCPVCGCVMRLRPSGYFKRFQASIKTIRSSIVSRVKTGEMASCYKPYKAVSLVHLFASKDQGVSQ